MTARARLGRRVALQPREPGTKRPFPRDHQQQPAIVPPANSTPLGIYVGQMPALQFSCSAALLCYRSPRLLHTVASQDRAPYVLHWLCRHESCHLLRWHHSQNQLLVHRVVGPMVKARDAITQASWYDQTVVIPWRKPLCSEPIDRPILLGVLVLGNGRYHWRHTGCHNAALKAQ